MHYPQRPERQNSAKHPKKDSLQELRVRRASPMPDARDAYDELKNRLLQHLVAEAGHQIDQESQATSRTLIQKRLDALLLEENILLKQQEKRQLTDDIVAELLGLGPTITPEGAPTSLLTVQELCDSGMLSKEIVDFLEAAVLARLNIVISGLARTGKTTLLRAICSFIPEDERIVTIEDLIELHLNHPHVISLKTQLDRGAGRSDISAESLIMTSARSRPDRLIIGSLQGAEAFAWLQAINATVIRSMTTCHAANAQDCLSLIEFMAQLGNLAVAQEQIRNQVMSAVHMIVHLERMSDGSLRVIAVSEIAGLKDDQFICAEIFQFEQSGQEDGQIIGTLQPTGVRSRCAERIRDAGIPLPTSLGI